MCHRAQILKLIYDQKLETFFYFILTLNSGNGQHNFFHHQLTPSNFFITIQTFFLFVVANFIHINHSLTQSVDPSSRPKHLECRRLESYMYLKFNIQFLKSGSGQKLTKSLKILQRLK